MAGRGISTATLKFQEGIETPRTLGRLTEQLVERQFSEDDIRKVLGFNWMRVYREVWDR